MRLKVMLKQLLVVNSGTDRLDSYPLDALNSRIVAEGDDEVKPQIARISLRIPANPARQSVKKSVLPEAFYFAVSRDLDDEYAETSQQQHRAPPAWSEQLHPDPSQYQSRADPPQHQGISLSLYPTPRTVNT